MLDAELYERTRKWWLLDERRLRKVGEPGVPVWAFAIAGGVVRAVYQITGWLPATPIDVAEDPRREVRWGFCGTPDPKMEERYLFGDVSRYITSQWPLRFLNC
jgi:hypothetical protein